MKILVTVVVPAISAEYDMLLPDFLIINEMVPLIASSVEELSNQVYISSGQEFLCLKERNTLLKHDATLAQYQIQNGDHLVLI